MSSSPCPNLYIHNKKKKIRLRQYSTTTWFVIKNLRADRLLKSHVLAALRLLWVWYLSKQIKGRRFWEKECRWWSIIKMYLIVRATVREYSLAVGFWRILMRCSNTTRGRLKTRRAWHCQFTVIVNCGGMKAILASKCVGRILTLFLTRCSPIQFSTFTIRPSSCENLQVKKQRPPGGGRFLVDPSKVFDYNNWWACGSFCVSLLSQFCFVFSFRSCKCNFMMIYSVICILSCIVALPTRNLLALFFVKWLCPWIIIVVKITDL